MTQWIQTSNTKQDGTPVTRAIKISGMGEEIFFTTNAYAEVSDDVADLLASQLDDISKVSEPASPGAYYGDAGQNTTTEIVLPDNAFDHFTSESGDVDELDTESTTARALAIASDEADPGLRLVEDPVSPVSFDSQSSVSFTTSNAYKKLLLVDDPDNTAAYDRMQVFGETMSYYDTKSLQSGNTYTGETEFRVPPRRRSVSVEYNPASKETRFHADPMGFSDEPLSGIYDYSGPNSYTTWDVTLFDSSGYDKTGDVVVIGVAVNGNA
jgi:hypothetical protein